MRRVTERGAREQGDARGAGGLDHHRHQPRQARRHRHRRPSSMRRRWPSSGSTRRSSGRWCIDGAVAMRRIMNLSSSFDHRFVDGYDAAAMIQALKELLEHPAMIFIPKVDSHDRTSATCDPEPQPRPAFGTVLTSHMAVATYRDGRWSEPRSSRSRRSSSSRRRTCCTMRAPASRDSRRFAVPTGRSTSSAWTGTFSACARARGSWCCPSPTPRSSPTWCAPSSRAAATQCRRRRARCICGRSCSAPPRISARRRRLRPRRCCSCWQARCGITSPAA